MYDARRWHRADWVRLGFLVVFAVLVAAALYYRFTVAPTMNGIPHFGWWFRFGGFWIFIGVFLFFGLARRAFWGPRLWGGERHGYGSGWYGRADEAFRIVRERYARGEITKDQYDAMMRDLSQPPQSPPRP
jgi:uncharacterized membrane protein